MVDERSDGSALALRVLSALAVLGTLGILATIRTSSVAPQVVLGVAVVLTAVLAWRRSTRTGLLTASAGVSLLPVLWHGWMLWRDLWMVSPWIILTGVALLGVLVFAPVGWGWRERIPGEAGVGSLVVIALTGAAWFGGSAAARATAEVSDTSDTSDQAAYVAGDGPGAFPYTWTVRGNQWPVDTAYGTVQYDEGSVSRIAGRSGGETVWTYELRPYSIEDFAVSSSGEILAVQFGLPAETAATSAINSRAMTTWLDAGTGQVMDTVWWQYPTPDDSGERAAIEATGRDWVLYEPQANERVRSEFVLAGRYRIDTNVRVGLEFEAGEGQRVAWVRDVPERCAEHVLWDRYEREWTLAADAEVIAVARVCVSDPASDATSQVAVSAHGVNVSTGEDEWLVEGPTDVTFEGWTPDYPDTDEQALEQAIGSMPNGPTVIESVEIQRGEAPPDPVSVGFRWGGVHAEDVELDPVSVDLRTGEPR